MLLDPTGLRRAWSDPEDPRLLSVHYCAENKPSLRQHWYTGAAMLPFIAYGLEFQKRFVPQPGADQTSWRSAPAESAGFSYRTTQGETLQARKVVIAVGITHFGYLPPFLADLSPGSR